MSLTVPCDARVTMHVTVPVTHLCPYADEVDRGVVEIRWTTAGATLELHALADYLAGYATDRISHEALTDSVQAALEALPGISDVHVLTRWETAGAEVVVTGCCIARTLPVFACVTP